MNHVQFDCPRCSTALRVRLGALFIDHAATDACSWVICGTCDDLVSTTVPRGALPALVAAGGHVMAATDRLPHPEQRPDGQPIVVDDVLALHELLADDVVLARALRDWCDPRELGT